MHCLIVHIDGIRRTIERQVESRKSLVHLVNTANDIKFFLKGRGEV